MRGRSVVVLLAVLAAVVLSSCGTGTFDAHYRVGVADGVTGVPVSMFDSTMGDTQDWAERTLGIASPAQPYEATITAVETRMVTDSGPSPTLSAGLYLPTLHTEGWYVVAFTPQDGVEQDVSATFVPWDPPGTPQPPLPLRVRATAEDSAWTVEISLPASVPATP